MITKKESESLRVAVRKLVRAEIASSWKGGQYPEDFPIIEEELRSCRIRFSVLLSRITDPLIKGES